MKSRILICTAVTTIILFASCTAFFEEEPRDNPEAIFDQLWTTFDRDYAVFEERGVNWTQQYNTFRGEVNAATTDDELFAILSEMLLPLNDGHVTLTAPGREVFISNTIRREKIDDGLFNRTVIRDQYLEPGFVSGEEDSYTYGQITNENIAYIHFDHVAENFFELNTFLDAYPSVNGYIIDLRHNDGGDFTYCFSEMGRLVDQERFVFRSKTKNGPGQNDFTPWHEWWVTPQSPYVNKPIIVLIDAYTISAGERAVMAFDVLPNVTLVGEITNGAHGTMIGRELANGWFFSLVTQKVELSDGMSYEGIGISPDIMVRNTPEEIQAGTDTVLETAIAQLK